MNSPRLKLAFAALAVTGTLVFLPARGLGQNPLPFDTPATATSLSGQFIVHGRDSAQSPTTGAIRPVGEELVISLRPDLLAVTCERVKKAILFRLDLHDGWRGKVHLHLQRKTVVERPIAIRPQLFRDGWQYHLAVPDQVEWTRLVRAITEVVLLELANRENPGDSPAQPPLWLTEGMNQLVLGDYGRDLVIESQTTLNRSARKPDALRASRERLQGREPLSFSALGLVTAEKLPRPDEFAHFQASAALLTQLLTGDDLRKETRTFIWALPANLNWQVTFLRVNRARFASLLDVEKWWAVNATHELARDPALRWSPSEVRARLAEILSETATVRDAAGGNPTQQTLPLSQIVATWDFATQEPVLRRKTAQLQVLAMRTPPELQGLVTDCFRTLDRYLTERTAVGTEPARRGEIENRAPVLVRSTARKLENLSRQVAAGQKKG